MYLFMCILDVFKAGKTWDGCGATEDYKSWATGSSKAKPLETHHVGQLKSSGQPLTASKALLWKPPSGAAAAIDV